MSNVRGIIKCEVNHEGHRDYTITLVVVGGSVIPFIPFYGSCFPSDPYAFRNKHVDVTVYKDHTIAVIKYSTKHLDLECEL